MISKVTKSNKALYEARLAEINRLLHEKNLISEDTEIDTLEKYYQHIVEIQKLPVRYVDPDTGEAYKSKYLLMPLDEPLFEIDANKRSISVPSDFNKNGIGVKGDHCAEVLYFKIDRYFDARDLYDGTDYIVINWQFRGANEGRNKELATHTSLAFAPDDTYIPGSIVFGWVIEQDMTPSKGTLSFSISFISKNTDNTYSYALNTTVASVAVNDSLYLEDPSILSTLKRPVMDRLRNSQFTPDNVDEVKQLKWRTGVNVVWDEEEENDFGLSGLPLIANFEYGADGEELDSILLTAVGAVDNQEGVNIKYTWSGSKFADGSSVSREPEIVREADGPSKETDWVLTKDEVAQEGIVYWTGEGRTKNRLVIDAGEEFPEGTRVYELGSSFEVEAAGDYLVEMQGERMGATSRSIPSKHCVVPHAAIPEVTLKVNAVSPAGSEDVEPYEIVDEEVASNYVFVGDAAPGVKAIVSKNESNVISRHAINGVDVVGKKLEIAPDDVNKVASQQNQDAIEIAQKDNTIIVLGSLSGLNSFASTNAAQGEGKWVGIDIGTNVNDITKLTWNGYALTADDVAEAASVGLEAGHIIFWAKAENLPRTIKLGRTGYSDTEIKVILMAKEDYEANEDEIDADKALENARQGIFKESELGQIAFTLVKEDEVPTINDFDDVEWQKYVEGKSFEIASEGASGEGSYCVYAANKRNHTYSISEPSNLINVSKIAPLVNGISIVGQGDDDLFNVELLTDNKQVIGADNKPVAIEIDVNHLSRNFELTIADNFDNIGKEDDRVEMNLRVVEIDQNKYVNEGVLKYPQEPADGSTDEYQLTQQGDTQKYRFTIDRDPGWYIVEVTTLYHGTRRVTVTEPFIVHSALNFN